MLEIEWDEILVYKGNPFLKIYININGVKVNKKISCNSIL